MSVNFFVTTLKCGRKVVGYEIMITDTSIVNNSEQNKNSR